MQVLSYKDLKEKGIPFSRVHIWRLSKKGEFPKSVKLGGNTAVWIEEEIDDWLRARVAERSKANAA